jgi:hypothetical protein
MAGQKKRAERMQAGKEKKKSLETQRKEGGGAHSSFGWLVSLL